MHFLRLFFLFWVIALHGSNHPLSKYDAIVIYAFGKTGTTSLTNLFGQLTKDETIPGYPHHAKMGRDTLSPHCERFGKAVHTHNPHIVKKLLAEGKKILVINSVRNLFDRNISHFFFKLTPFVVKNFEGDDLFNTLFEKYKDYTFKHTEVSGRFYTEFKDALSVDVFAHPFDFSRSCLFLKNKQADILILRLEDIKHWDAILERELHLKNVIIPNSLSASKTWYRDLYNDFRSKYRYSEDQIEKILSVDFMTHFYTPKEIDLFIQKYR